jgi:hypothetical protein
MEHIYQPFDVRITDDEEIIAIVEPDSYLEEMIENKESCWEIELDVDYDEETEEAFLMVTLHKDNGQIFMAFPYGEAWDALSEKGVITVALLTQYDLDHGDVHDAITITLELDEHLKGFVEGAGRMWEAVQETVEKTD